MQLILLTGLPGTGKSTLAEALSYKLSIPVFSKDLLEATLLRCHITTVLDNSQPVSYAVYELLFMLTEQQLRLQQSCIIDCVASHENVRKQFKLLADQYHAEWIVIECICSHEETHRRRLSTRQRNIPGYRELDWDALLQTKARYMDWDEEYKVIDSVDHLEHNINLVLSYIAQAELM